MNRTARIELAAIAAVVLALLGISRVRINSGTPALDVSTKAATGVDSRVEPGEAGAQASEAAPVPGVSPTSRTLRGTKGSSTDPRSEEENPEGTRSGDSESAGPPVHYTDQANDAYGPDASPNAALSQPAFDILRVDWGPVPYVDEQNPGGYSTSITIAGAARADGWYISYGHGGLWPNPPSCTLYHVLAPGTMAYATSMCSWGEAGRVPGSRVSSTPTATGGTILSATFDNRALPPPFQGSGSGRTLRGLGAMTCMQRSPNGWLDCSQYDVLDRANSTLTYRI